MLHPQARALLELIEQRGVPPTHTLSPAEARRYYLERRHLTQPAPSPVGQILALHADGPRGKIPLRLYRPLPGASAPSATHALPALVYFHGGGWVIGDLDTHDITCRTIATSCRAVVVAVDYRLAPEHPAPAPVEDALASARWISEHLAELGGTADMGVAGDSAGGNLSAVVAQVFRDEHRPLAGQLLFYPGTDLVGDYPSLDDNATGYFLDLDTIGFFMDHYVGHLAGEGLDDPRLSPLHGDVSGVAPAVVVTAQFDPLRDQGIAYATKLAEAGVAVQETTCPGLIHGFVDMGRYSAAAHAAIEDACTRFARLLHP